MFPPSAKLKTFADKIVNRFLSNQQSVDFKTYPHLHLQNIIHL